MRYIVAALLNSLFFSFNPASAQSLSGIVTYECIFKLDSSINNAYENKMTGLLFFDGIVSSFKYHFAETNNGDSIQNEPSVIPGDSIGDIIFKDLADKKISIRQQVWGTAYITEEPLPTIKWALGDEYKMTGNFLCQKAITQFRGREYEAWFTRQIPVASGPWKFHGLPGLVLEAYDRQHQVAYHFVGITMPASIDKQLIAPSKGTRIDFDTYKTIWERETKRLKEFLISHAVNGGNTDIRINITPIEKNYD